VTPADRTPLPDRRKALLTALIWSVAFGLIAYTIAVAMALVAALVAAPGFDAASEWLASLGAVQMVVQGMAALGGGLLATYVVGVRRFGMARSDLRWQTSSPAVVGFGTGLLFGVLPALGVLVASAVLGEARWHSEGGTLWDFLVAGGGITLTLVPAALAEEILFRGVPIVLVAVALGRGSAIVLVAVVFGLAHLLNPSVTGMGVANVTLAGVLLGTVFYGPGGLWAAFGAHLGWNAMLAVSGTEVSGLPFEVPGLRHEAGGPEWLTGGAFGPEGGLLATMMLGLAVMVAARRIRSDGE